MRNVIGISYISSDGAIHAMSEPDEDLSEGFAYGGWVAPYADEVVGTVAI